MKRGTIIAIAVGVLLVAAAAAGVAATLMPRTRPEPVPLEIKQLASLEQPPAAVTVRGTAHYRGVVTQNVPASLAGPAQQYAVYGLFPLHDTMGKEIRLLVRTPFGVPRRIDYEYVQVTGWLERPRPHTIPAQTEQMFAKADYFFSDDVWVIEAWEVETFDPAEGMGE